MRYIDADALMAKVGFLEGRVVGVYKSDIEKMPTADAAEVVHAKWQLLDECSNAGVYCSVCHKAVFRENAWYKNVHIKSKFCPNCGAKMDGKHEKL